MGRHQKPRIKKLRSLYIWHRYIGVSAALLVVVLASTGLMLNHTEKLQLDSHYVSNPWLLDQYGIHAPANVHSYHLQNHWLSQWGERLFLDQVDLGETQEKLQGGLFYKDMLVIALKNKVWLLTPQGELIEKLGNSEGIPTGISAIGITDDGQVAVMTAQGVYTANRDLSIWQDAPKAIAVWVDKEDLPASLNQRLLEKYRGHGLSLERVILDLHSGRIFGPYGLYIMDAAAVLMLFLAFSGSWIWVIRQIRNHQQKQPVTKPGKQPRRD